ncbi:MAG: ATP-dependent helicase, partial [Planctomycetota bacterium]
MEINSSIAPRGQSRGWEDILASLTASQREAIEHVEGPQQIIAGPGSGKTRVVTHRIAHMLRKGIPEHCIVALTFTNKAADEMRQRVDALCPGRHVWIGTFHRFCAQQLRRHASLVGLRENYSILDVEAGMKVLRQAVDEAGVELVHDTPRRIAGAISWAKNDLITPEQYQPASDDPVGALVDRVYPHYQRLLLGANSVDFDDLLMHVAVLLRDNPELRQTLDKQFRYIMVDEYQDTNLAQYAIVRSLSIDYPNLSVTGDPDQSIYGWRGATIRNILEFERDFSSVHVVRLEENFRSTQSILQAADQLIANNVNRKEKRLESRNAQGKPVRVSVYPTARLEADAVAARIANEVSAQQRRYRDYAIFYRTNALSRTLE